MWWEGYFVVVGGFGRGWVVVVVGCGVVWWEGVIHFYKQNFKNVVFTDKTRDFTFFSYRTSVR